MFYSNSETGKVLQTIRTATQVVAVKDGCKVRGVGSDGTGICVGFPRDGVTLQYCGVDLQETGEDGGPDMAVDDSVPAYGGGGDGTNPGGDGGGTGGDGGTGGGGTGGDGGTGGGGTGGGGTGGGGTGGGDGGTGGGGNGGDGSGNSGGSCGGSSQPPCKIDESGTPNGKGIFKELLDWLERAGVMRQAGLDQAISNDGKPTGLTFMSLPSFSANCSDPSFTIVGREFTVPICKYISMIGAGFEAFWAIAFALAVMSMVSRAMNKPVS